MKIVWQRRSYRVLLGPATDEVDPDVEAWDRVAEDEEMVVDVGSGTTPLAMSARMSRLALTSSDSAFVRWISTSVCFRRLWSICTRDTYAQQG